MPLGLNAGPSTASTASMFSFASSNSQMEKQSAYSVKNPYAQQAKTAGDVHSSASVGKSKGFGKALSGLGKRFASSSKKGASTQERDVLADAATKTAATMISAAAGPSLGGIGDGVSPNQFNSDPVSVRNYTNFETHGVQVNLTPSPIPTQRTSASFPTERGSPAIQAVVVVGSGRRSDAASVGSMGGPAKKKTKSNPTKVQHQYQDYSSVTDEVALHDAVERKNTGGVVTPFPEKLHEMLSLNLEIDVIDWAAHGRCFVIKKPKVFAGTIMPKHFKHTKITSFQRQLNLYGFKRITKGKDRTAYYHELFLRGRPMLSTKMRRQRIKGVGHKPIPDPDNEPDFYAMEPLDPPVQAQADDQLSDAASLSQLSGLQSFAASVQSGGMNSLTTSIPSVQRNDIAHACLASVTSLPQSVLPASGMSNASPVSIQQAQMLGIVAQQQQQQQTNTPGATVSGASQQNDELQLLSQLLEQQRQQIEQQQHQLQQRQQQLLQEELIMQQKEVLLLQQQQHQHKQGHNIQGLHPVVVSSHQLAQQQMQQPPKFLLTPANMNVSFPLNCDATATEMSAVSGADFSEVGALEAPAPLSGMNVNAMDVDTGGGLSSSQMPPPAAKIKTLAPDLAQSSEPFPDILQVIATKQAPSSNEDPSVGLSSFGSGSKKSASRRGISTANKSMASLTKRLSTKSWGSIGSTSKASRASGSRRKMPWSKRSQASASSNGSDAWLDEEQKMALEATIDFDSIFEGAAAH